MARLIGIDPEHRGQLMAATASLALLLGAHTMLEVARDALFLEHLPAEELPFTYLGIAAAAWVAARLDRNLLRFFDKRRLSTMTLLVAAGGTLGFWALFATRQDWVPHAFYVWTGLVATFAVTQFWRLVGAIFTATEAKRVYTWIATGGSLGALGGATLASAVMPLVGPDGLLVLGAAVLALSAFIPLCVEEQDEATRTSLDAESREGRSDDAYLRSLLVLVLLAAVSATFIDFVFKATIDDAVPPDELGTFFGRFYIGLNAVALLVQLFVAPRLLRLFGANRAMALLPTLLVVGATGSWLFGGIAAATLLRGTDGGLRHSLYRSAMELLYLPLPARVRDTNKAFIDAIGQRGGQAVGSVIILGVVAAGFGPRVLAAAVVLLALAWAGLALYLRRAYVDLFRQNVQEGSIAAMPQVPELDLSSLEYLMASLNSERDEEVLSTLEFLEEYGRAHLVPALLLYHPSEAVVLRTLELFSVHERDDYLGVARRLLDHESEEVRAAAIREVVNAMDPKDLARLRSSEQPTEARVATLVATVSRGLDDDGAAAAELDECTRHAEPRVRRALARAIRLRKDPSLAPMLFALAKDAPTEVRRSVARAFGALRDESAISLLISWLGDRLVRDFAREALVALGQPALDALRTAFDEDHPRNVRGHLPRTVSRFLDPEAADILIAQLEREEDGWVRYKILRGLRGLKLRVPNLELPPGPLMQRAEKNLRRAAEMLSHRVSAERAHELVPARKTKGGELLSTVLAEKVEQAVQRAVRLIALAHPKAELGSIRHALRRGDRRLKSEGRELLANLVPFELGPVVEGLLDDGPDRQRLDRIRRATDAPPPTDDYPGLLRTLLQDESVSVRATTAFHVGELRLEALRPDLQAALSVAGPEIDDVLERAIAALEEPEELGFVHGAFRS